MTKSVIALLAVLAFGAVSFITTAQARECPEGQVLNPETGDCVVPDGSH